MEIIAALIIACTNLTFHSDIKTKQIACINRVTNCGQESMSKIKQTRYQLENCSKEVY